MNILKLRLLSARILALFFAALFCFASCAQSAEPAVKPDYPQEQTPAPVEEPARLSEEQRDELIFALSQNADKRVERLAGAEFLSFFEAEYGAQTLKALYEGKDAVTSESLYALCGSTAVVLYDLCHGLPENVRVMESPRASGACIRVVGDVSFADNWKILPVLLEKGEGVDGVMSKEVLALLRSADVTLVNNEFTYSTRGAPLANKAYTFRADPSRVEYMKEIGADLISLANNHAYDYGADAFADTLATLKGADLPYIGGGENIEEASRPFYYIVNGRKYAFSAATRAEKYILTPEATESSSGVLRTYDPAAYLGVIALAEENCDTNIVYVHWGTEDSHATEKGLYELAVRYIDAGADIVVGAHAHILQGIDYYNEVPIIYNLGNFLFNAETTETGILELQFDERGALSTRLIPCMRENCTVRAVYREKAGRVLDLMRSLSSNVAFTSDGAFSRKKP